MMSLKKIRLTAITRAALVGVVLVGSVATAMLMAKRGPAVLAKMTTAASPAPATAAPMAKLVSAPPAQAAGRVKPTTPARAAGATPNAKPSLVTAAATTPAAVTPANAAATTPAAVTPANTVTEAAEVITLTGCLQHDDGAFRLKDTIGADAPKSRSWKSGFLKKRAASVEIVDSANRLRLPTHVGQRVSITGVLLEREMRARAVQRLGVCS